MRVMPIVTCAGASPAIHSPFMPPCHTGPMHPELDPIAFFRELLAADPGAAPVRASLAAALLAAGALADAIAEATAALAVAPGRLDARLTRAEAHRRRHDHAAAILDLHQAARLAPERAAIHHALGAALAETDALAEAAGALRRAAALAPAQADVAATLGSVLLRQGEWRDAEAATRHALSLDPTLAIAHRNLAALLERRDPAASRRHRELGFAGRSLEIIEAPEPLLRVLVLCATGDGNIPLRHLLPPRRITVLRWYVAYARAEQVGALPDYDLILNAIGDPERMPALPAAVARILAAPPRPLLNPPEQVARTSRVMLPRLLDGIPGILVPTTRGDAAVTLPALVRPLGAHGGEGVVLTRTPAERDAALAAAGAATLTQYIDCRDPDGWFRKYRVIFIDRVPYPYHLAISPHWLVHYWTAGMAGDPVRRAEEAQFLTDPAAALGAAGWAALGAIGARLDLDFAGIDFGLRADGRLVVFEANATMLVHPETDPVFAYRNGAVAAILAAFQTLLARRQAGPMPGNAAA